MLHASPHVAYVTPSRLATRTASSNSPSACACHLDVVTLRRFTPATGHGGRGRGAGGEERGGAWCDIPVYVSCAAQAQRVRPHGSRQTISIEYRARAVDTFCFNTAAAWLARQYYWQYHNFSVNITAG